MDDKGKREVTFISQWPPETDNIDEVFATEKPKAAKKIRIQGPNSGSSSVTGISKSKAITESLFLWAQPAVAKWWRKRFTFTGSITTKEITIADSAATKLKRIVKRADTQIFIEERISNLRNLCHKFPDDARYYSALASYYDLLGNYKQALELIERAFELDSHTSKVAWLREKIKRAHSAEVYRSYLQIQLAASQRTLNATMADPIPVDRISAKELSFKAFFYQYAMIGRPVIITDLVEKMVPSLWTFEYVRQVAGNKRATVKRLVSDSVEWARLEPASTVMVKEYINTIENEGYDDLLYLFDWSLPIHCPELAKELTIPKYFASDFLQRVPKGTLYHDSWPSLFVAPKGARSELHIDAFGSSFWMALFQGRKRWTFFRKEDMPLLYPSYCNSLDAIFDIDLSNIDYAKYELAKFCQRRQCILQPGELLFVPSGCPHRVENLDKSIAVSANFVDLSNFDRVTEELQSSSLIDNESQVLLSQLLSSDFFTDMSSEQDDLKWEEFKDWQSIKTKYTFDITLGNIEKHSSS